MRYDPDHHHRRSIRMSGYDYAQAGAYFVTICAHERQCVLGTVADGAVQLSPFGSIVERSWRALARDFPNVELDAFVVMPNHIHGIVLITQRRGEAFAENASPLPQRQRPNGTPPPATGRDISPLPQRYNGTVAGSLGATVQNFKSVSSRRINALRGTPGTPVWQRNYYEHVIRTEDDLNRIRQYIDANPGGWATDEENPTRVGAGV